MVGGRRGGSVKWMAAVAAAACVLWACQGKQREFLSSTERILPDAGPAAPGTTEVAALPATSAAPPPEPRLSALGEACDNPRSCSSGYCVDGVCCDGACTELCATCAAPGSVGTCSAAASDTACQASSCPGATECRGRDQTSLALNCEAVGKCRSEVACEPLDAPAGTPCRDGTGSCDGQGACVVPGKVSLGGACSGADECAEGNCVPGPNGMGICCDAPCSGLCQQCSPEGRCEAAPAHDDRCEPVVCPADNPCRDYPDELTENLCRGFGQCRTAQDCAPTALRPATSCDCDATGTCTLRRGIRCGGDEECGAGATCIPGVAGESMCCAEVCGPGLFCSRDGSGCVECEDVAVTCDGTNAVRCEAGQRALEACANGCTPGEGCNTEAPVGFECASAACAEGAVCQADVDGVQRCCVRDCAAEGKECAPDGSCVCPAGQASTGSSCALQQGDPCGSGPAQCDAGLTCVDGVCCNDSCDGACESCNLPGSAGVCSFDATGATGCSAGEQCVGRNDCRGGLAQSCSVAGDCVSNNCEPLMGVNGRSICCAANCQAPRGFCSSDGSRCVECQGNGDCPNGCNVAQGVCNPLRALGQTCNVAQQCSSGACLPDASDSRFNRCCPGCRPGQLCTSQGTCQDPPLGAGGRCQNDAQCAGGLFCRDGVCCTSACDGPCESCGGNGVCNTPLSSDPQRCGPVTCALPSNACRTVTPPAAGQCASLGQCAGSAQCSVQFRPAGTACNGNGQCDGAGNCVAPVLLGSGQACSTDSQCSSNSCELSAANPAQGICCIENCAAGQFCRLRSPTVHECIECVNDSQCNNGCNEVSGACEPLLANGQTCAENRQCASGSCALHYIDPDDDEYAVVGAATERFCVGSGFDVGGFTTRQATGSLTTTDCQENNANVFPGQTRSFTTPAVGKTVLPFDYNCDGQERSPNELRNRLRDCDDTSIANCSSRGGYFEAVPACGLSATFLPCAIGASGGPTACGGGAGGPIVRDCR